MWLPFLCRHSGAAEAPVSHSLGRGLCTPRAVSSACARYGLHPRFRPTEAKGRCRGPSCHDRPAGCPLAPSPGRASASARARCAPNIGGRGAVPHGSGTWWPRHVGRGPGAAADRRRRGLRRARLGPAPARLVRGRRAGEDLTTSRVYLAAGSRASASARASCAPTRVARNGSGPRRPRRDSTSAPRPPDRCRAGPNADARPGPPHRNPASSAPLSWSTFASVIRRSVSPARARSRGWSSSRRDTSRTQ